MNAIDAIERYVFDHYEVGERGFLATLYAKNEAGELVGDEPMTRSGLRANVYAGRIRGRLIEFVGRGEFVRLDMPPDLLSGLDGTEYHLRLRKLGGKHGPPRTHSARDRTARDRLPDMLRDQGNDCPVCGHLILHAIHADVDHWQPISSGGADEPTNMLAVHRGCNLVKGDDSIEQARRRLRGKGCPVDPASARRAFEKGMAAKHRLPNEFYEDE